MLRLILKANSTMSFQFQLYVLLLSLNTKIHYSTMSPLEEGLNYDDAAFI